MIETKRYTPQSLPEWDAFVRHSKNGLFLFERAYMDYHSDRFTDSSLMFYSDGELIAILPANRLENSLYTHQGLTFGGVISNKRMTAKTMLDIFDCIAEWMHSEHLTRLIYKAIPHIYHTYPAEEDLYALFRQQDARLIGRDIATTIIRDSAPKWAKGRHAGINKAIKAGVTVEMSDDFSGFWQVLNDNLRDTYGATPVHTLEEITLLKHRFPDNILLCQAVKDGTVVGGVVLYKNNKVLRTQYISANAEGKRCASLDLIMHHLLHTDLFPADQYPLFDFGKSTEDHGHILNESLIFQKEGFGGRGVCYDTYEWKV